MVVAVMVVVLLLPLALRTSLNSTAVASSWTRRSCLTCSSMRAWISSPISPADLARSDASRPASSSLSVSMSVSRSRSCATTSALECCWIAKAPSSASWSSLLRLRRLAVKPSTISRTRASSSLGSKVARSVDKDAGPPVRKSYDANARSARLMMASTPRLIGSDGAAGRAVGEGTDAEADGTPGLAAATAVAPLGADTLPTADSACAADGCDADGGAASAAAANGAASAAAVGAHDGALCASSVAVGAYASEPFPSPAADGAVISVVDGAEAQALPAARRCRREWPASSGSAEGPDAGALRTSTMLRTSRPVHAHTHTRTPHCGASESAPAREATREQWSGPRGNRKT